MFKCITVFGSGTAGRETPLYKTAYELGFLLGKANFTHVSGGYGGTMEAGAKGAFEAGAKTIGVIVQSWGPPNPYIKETHTMPDLFQRIKKLMELGDGYIALPGATGTLIELSMAWERVNKHIDHPKPIVLLGDFWLPIVNLIKSEMCEPACGVNSKLGNIFGGFIWLARSPEETVSFLKNQNLS